MKDIKTKNIYTENLHVSNKSHVGVNGFWDFLLQTLSARGVISAKRVLGALVLFVCLVCIVILVFREGGTIVVENLLEMAMLTSLGLLGISNITAIWKGGRGNMTQTGTGGYNYMDYEDDRVRPEKEFKYPDYYNKPLYGNIEQDNTISKED